MEILHLLPGNRSRDNSPVAHLVDGDGHVPRLDGTRVHVAVVLGHEVDVVEDETVEVVHLERLHEADVHDAGLVEGVGAELRQNRGR